MRVIALEETTLTVPELVQLVAGEDVILTRDGQPLVSVRNVDGSDWESASLAHNPRFKAMIQQSRDSLRSGGGIGLDDLRDQFGLDRS